jgi:F0F1-type ATP synthase beta subunit
VVREVPVDRVVTKYVTDPATLARLAELEAALTAKKADIDERISMPRLDTKTMPEVVRNLIQSESKTVDELIQEYADLTNLIMMPGLDEEAQRARRQRQQKLHSIVQWSQSQNA